MGIVDTFNSFHLSKEQNYIPPWVALNNPSAILFLKYYACGVVGAVLLALLYSTYGNYFAVCRDTPAPRSERQSCEIEGEEDLHPSNRRIHHRRHTGFGYDAMQRDLDMEVASP